MTTSATRTSASDGGGEGDDRVLAAAQQIVKNINAPKEVREDMLLILSSFDNRLSNLTSMIGDNASSGAAVADNDGGYRFEAAEKVILQCDTSRAAVTWQESSQEYLSAVDEILTLTEALSIGGSGREDEVSERAENAIQIAMARLEDEFRHMLISNTVRLDSDRLRSCSIRRRGGSLSFAAAPSNEGEFVPEDFESFGGGVFHERGISLGSDGDDDVCVDLINPDAVAELKEIAEHMIRCGYEKECVQVYSSVRRDVLDECMTILGVEKLSIEEVQRIEWKVLDEKMKKWIRAAKIGVRVLLAGEKRLTDYIFEGTNETREICFNETTKGCIIQLLNFGEAVAIGRRSPEKLFRILDMYDVLADVYADLEEMVSEELVVSEAKGVLDELGDAARGTFAEFENAVKGEASKKPMLSGEIHPISRYVMNYVRLLVDYSETLNLLLDTGDDKLQGLPNADLGIDSLSPIGVRLLLLLNNLESNLSEKSKVYEDGALQCVFMMNNIQYIVQKVKDSELRKLLGDTWIRKRRGQVRQYATGYLRAAWSNALSFLRDEGIGISASNTSKMALKERFKNFNAVFEDLYKIQTAWKVPDVQLREELRISISEKVIPAYRSFMGRFGSQLESGRHAGRYIKYTADDLESYVLDLFEGAPRVLHHLRRKST